MFSPSVHDGGPATATRSRRRQRPQSTDSLVQPPKAKRQRIPLTEQTFQNPDVPPETYDVKPDKNATLEIRQDGFGPENHIQQAPRKELSVRAKKPKAVDRAIKGDGSILLTTNNAYTVHKLPALPDRIRVDASTQQHGDIFSSGYALSLSHTHAVVWPYTAPSQSPETFTFTLPHPSKHATDPLPFGCLVSPSASSSEPGLVVVMPVSGKITYWESISSAATLDFIRQQRHGVEGTVSGMFAGERVVQINNAESAGFVLALSSGRLAYLSVRDGHGRPMISVQILRGGTGTAAGGIFGSIRNVLSHSVTRGDIAAVRSESTPRVGERNVVAATLKGKLHAWKIHRGGHHDSVAEADVREDIYNAIHEVDPVSADFGLETFEVVDFTYVPKGLESKYKELSRLSDALSSDDPNLQHLLLLVSLSKKRESHYSLVEVILTPSSAQIGMVRPLPSYKTRWTSVNPGQSDRPRLYLPRPGLVAFAVFDKAVVVASIGCPPDSPESQLQEDSHILPPSYEDVLSLSDNQVAEVIGSGFEEPLPSGGAHDDTRSHRHKTKNPAVVLIVRGTGILRLTTTEIDRFASDKPPKVDAKSKLDQAVFFGDKQDTPLNFDGRKGVQFSDEEMSEAALQVSHEILSSSTPHISTVPASLEDNLRSRAAALERLMYHLRALNVQLDRRTRWLLLSHAEKMNVASLLWKKHETFTNDRPANEKKDLVAEIVEFIHQSEKKVPNRNIGEVDRVRHWFIHDVGKLEIFVAWAYEVIKYMYKDHILDDARITRLIHEAVEVNLSALITALEYRQDKLAFYGLQNETLDFGILHSGYEGLPESWTGSNFICNNLKRLLELCHQWLEQYNPPSKERSSKKPDPKLIGAIVADIGPLTDSYLISLLEQARWAGVQQDEKSERWAEHCTKLYETDRSDKVLSLLRLNKWDECIQIAEKHRSWKALALSLIEQIHSLRKEAEATTSTTDITKIQSVAKEKEEQLGKLFDKYGEAFAFPAYDILLENDSVNAVLDFAHDRHGYKTKFLRQKPELARISWINDIQGEKDIDHAAETLLDLGMTREQQIWNKKIELSLGKLALLAESSEPEPTGLFGFTNGSKVAKKDEGKQGEQLEEIDNELAIIQIQDDLYSQVFPSVQTAVDDSAALDLAMEAHCLNVPRQQKALSQIFENGMRRLLKHEALDAHTLIDLLTLIALKPETADDMRDPFFLAVQVAEHALEGEELKTVVRLIWRRCFIRDDWVKLNDTQLKDDAQVQETLGETALFSALLDCYAAQTIEKPFQPFRPSDALGAYVDGLDRRFGDMDKPFKDRVVATMKWEDTTLRKYIEKARLENWVRSAAEAAEATIAAVADQETIAGAQENGDAPSEVDTPTRKLNGYTNGTH
ncbi:Non-repetitive/WGA-negative nucleoporin C-terminal-domain-containing protein [Plectosphaerella plurivora]|uniref:Non-repetitive/WGA-negative nucleoporin C-terminal-domain-containing protein n=1 Tax=Plectosphaerella plurivora TaxID=936078 RepID=A0A9P8VG36_9PEZI|nr:Non-repetitive/WGA-negative nucleoporin C-terminal-domain-containing protein [Plectosphaerella plurivora]